MTKRTGKRFIWLTSISMVLLLGFNTMAWAQSSSEKESALQDIILENGSEWIITGNTSVDRLEIDDTSTISADYPVIVFFNESNTVENGEVIGNVQFVSDWDEKIAIVHTNDVHGHIEIEPYVKGFADSLKESGDYSLVLTVSAGDVYAGGEAVASSYNGEFIPAIMDKVYDIVVPGNNDYGLNAAAKQHLLLSALYDNTITLCSNYTVNSNGIDMQEYVEEYGDAWIGNQLFDELYDKISLNEDGSVNWSGLNLNNYTEGENPYQSEVIYETENGTHIGVFGLSTSGGAASTLLTSSDSIKTAQASADSLIADGADVVVAVGHTGWPDGDSTLTATSANDTNSAQIALNTTGIDAFVDGHTHSVINNGEGWIGGSSNTFINQAASFGTEIGIMYIYLNDGEVVAKDGEIISDFNDIQADKEVQELVTIAEEITEADLGTIIGYTDYFLNGERQSAGNEGGSVRGNETNLGDLMTDIVANALTEQGYDIDFVIIPGYWLRSSIEEGDITVSDIQSVFSNPTVLNYVTFSAADIVNEMTSSISVIPGEGQNFLQVSGINIEYILDDDGATLYKVYVADTLIYEDGEFIVDDDWSCSGIYTLTGGEIDSWTGSTDSWVCNDNTEVQELIINYIKTHQEGVDYTIFENTIAPDGRIVSVSLDEDPIDTDDVQVSETDADTTTSTDDVQASGTDDTTTGTDGTQTFEESNPDSEALSVETNPNTSEMAEGIFWLIVFGAALFASIIISKNRRR